MENKKVLNKAGLTKASHYFLTMSGVFVNTQTVTLTGPGGAVVFTAVTALTDPAVPGEFVIGTAAANLLQLLAVIENPYLPTSASWTALTPASSALIASWKLTADASATVLTIYNPTFTPITVAETQTNGAWTSYSYSNPFSLTADNTSLQIIGESISGGNGVVTLEVSNDGENWATYNRLTSNATNTNAQQDTRVASITQSANGSAVVMIPETDKFCFGRVKLVVTTNGLYTVVVCNK